MIKVPVLLLKTRGIQYDFAGIWYEDLTCEARFPPIKLYTVNSKLDKIKATASMVLTN